MAFSNQLNVGTRPLTASQAWAIKQNQAYQAEEKAKLHQASQMFEAQFIKMMMGEMRKTLTKDEFMGGGFGEEMFTGPLDEARADIIAQGRSIGIAEMLEKQLGQNACQRPIQFRMPPAAGLADNAQAAGRPAQAIPVSGKMQAINIPATQNTLVNAMPGLGLAGQEIAKHEPLAERGMSPLKARLEEIKSSAQAVLEPDQASSASAPLAWPLDAQISSQFGMRFHPILKSNRTHSGIDLKAPAGTPVQAALDGQVVFVGNRGQLGKTVVVEHSDGRQTVYAHCSRLLVNHGQAVAQGQVIAKVGSTGRTTGPHLHFEVRDNDGQAINPLLSLAPRDLPASGLALAKEQREANS